MAVQRVRHPNRPPADRDLGPCHAIRHAYGRMRLPIDIALTRTSKPQVTHMVIVTVEPHYR